MMKEEKYSRYEFLKKMGFQGGALMAILASCTHQDDAILQSLIDNKNGDPVASLDSTNKTSVSSSASTPTNPVTSTPSGGTTTGGTTSSSLPVGKVSTADLALIKNPVLRVDLAATNAKNLTTEGGYVILSNIVIGRTASGDYVAGSNLCTHEPKRRVIFNKTEFFCTDHGARFSLTGQNLNTVARTPLQVFKTANDGATLLIYS
jgi:nitrite reductase/ring-hydroxylating ferredoxin subunit